jgi:hypothetical protein
MTAAKNTPIRRSLRRFTLGSGPIKRRSDRVQLVARVVVVLSFLLAPPLAVAVATGASAHLQAVADAETAELSRTSAVLLENAPTLADGNDFSVLVLASWVLPAGTPGQSESREGVVFARQGTPAGTVIPLWLDRAGHPTRAPMDHADISAMTTLIAAVALIGLPLATWALYVVLCLMLDARRDRRWEQDWAAVEPEWHSRLL